MIPRSNGTKLTAGKLLREDFFAFSGTKGRSYELFGSEENVRSLSSLFLMLEDDARDLLSAAGFMKIKGEGNMVLLRDKMTTWLREDEGFQGVKVQLSEFQITTG